MRITEVISGLQTILAEYGDLECYYSIDSEGNGYHQVSYESSIMFKHEEDDEYYQELFTQEDLNEIKQECEEGGEVASLFDESMYEKICCVN